MGASDPSQPTFGSRTTLAWLLGALLLIAYAMLPDSAARRPGQLGGFTGAQVHPRTDAHEDADDEPSRPEILTVSPRDPYPGSTLIVVHSPTHHDLHVYAGKTPLRILARRPSEMVVELPRALEVGDVKLRLASVEPGGQGEAVPFSERSMRSKPFHIRVRAPNWRKVFRGLIGGAALAVLGIGFLSRGVRQSTGLEAARLLTRATRHRSLVLGCGALLGAIAQSTTGAAGMLAGLTSSRVLPVLPSAIAFLGAPLGATVVPLLVTGLVEPHDGLVAVAVGVLWLGLTADRRAHALARLVLGAGLLAFGLQVLQPGLEVFLSDAMLWSAAEHLRSDSLSDLLLCAALGSAAVAAFHGPAPLIVLILGVSQATGNWNLRTDLALLSGTGLGASLAALITAPLGLPARVLARLNLCLGALGTLIGLCCVDLWAGVAEFAVGPIVSPLHWTRRVDMSELGLRLAVAFGLSQFVTALVLMLLAPRIARGLDRRHIARRPEQAQLQSMAAELRAPLERVLRTQRVALGHVMDFALTGARARAHHAEQALAEARRLLDCVLSGPVRALPGTQEAAALARAAYASLQLQNALDDLLRQTEAMIDARIASTDVAAVASMLPSDDETALRSLHRLVSEGLEAASASLRDGASIDLELARAREIRINRIEADARGVLLEPERALDLRESHLHVLQVVDAYEVCGNQIYRLSEVLDVGISAPALLAV